MLKKVIITLFFVGMLCSTLKAQSNPNCPNATGATPHCVVLVWTPPSFGTGYNIYLGGTSAGNCSSVTASTCTKITSVPGLVTSTFTVNSSTTLTLIEGDTYYFAVTTTNGTAESTPLEVKATPIPFLVPSPVTNLSGTSH